MSHLIYKSILNVRDLTLPTNPIWKMNISPEEQTALADTLRDAYVRGVLKDYGKEAALYYAVWWQRTYSGGSPSKEMIAESVGIPTAKSDALYRYARRAMRQWGFRPIHDTRYHYFRSLLLQGGLPMNHVVNNSNNFNNYKVFLKSLVHDLSNITTEFTADIVPQLSCVSYLPKSFCNNSIYEISVQIAHAIIEGREDLLPYDSSKGGELKELTDSLRKTASQARKERNRKPLSIFWELRLDADELCLSYYLNNIANIGSEMIERLDAKDCFSFDVFMSTQYVATYKRISLVEDELGLSHGIYHRMNFEQRHFTWKGESYIELKLIPNEGDCIFVSALNCYPPDFSTPQQFQKANDFYVQQSGRKSEENIIICSELWKSYDSIPQHITFEDQKLLCYSFEQDITLENTSTGEELTYTNTYTRYSAEFGGVFIPWLEKSNFKLLCRMPNISVFDDGNNKIASKQYSVSLRKAGEREWIRLDRNSHLPFGLLEIRVRFPDGHYNTERFYNIGNMTFQASKETVDSAIIDYYGSHGEAFIEKSNSVETTASGHNRWAVKRVEGTAVSPTIAFSILHRGDPILHIELPAPFKGILLADSKNQQINAGDIISADNLYSYRIISHGIAKPLIRISYVNSSGEEERVAITGTVNDGITPLSNFEESVQRMYDLYVNDYTDERNYVSLLVNGANVKIRRFAFVPIISDDGNTVEIRDISDKQEENKLDYQGEVMAIKSGIDQSVENVEVVHLERKDPHTFTFPNGMSGDGCVIFSGKYDVRKIIPLKISAHQGANFFEQIRNYWHDSEWGEKLDEDRLDNGNYWQLAIRFFEVASEYKLPFQAFGCLNEILKEPVRLAKFILSMFICGKQELFVSEVNRLEQEYAIGIHWIKAEEWQVAFSSIFSLYEQTPAIIGMLLPNIVGFLRDIFNSTLDSDYTNTLVSYIMKSNIGHANKLSLPEMLELRSRSVGKTYGNNDLPRLEIKLQGSYYPEQAKRGMTFYQLTMIKAPIRIVEYLRNIGPDLWHDDSQEKMAMRRVINFYRTYFNTVYSQILERILKYTTKR